MRTYFSNQSYRIRSKRARVLRAKKVSFYRHLLILGILFFLFFTALFLSRISPRAKETNETEQKYFTSRMITYEMSAQDYAREYADPDHYESELDYLKEVCSINNLTMVDGTIEGAGPGNYLIFPYYVEEEE